MPEKGADQMSAQERAALAMWLLVQRPHTTAGIARRVGLSERGTRRLLAHISRVVPIYAGVLVDECTDKRRKFWQICK